MTERHDAPMPDWLKRRLENAGLMDPATGATRRARAARCAACRRPVMRGIDLDYSGLAVDCDPTPLSPEGELSALLAGRRTYTLRWLGERYEIDRRDIEQITGSPAGTPRLDVLVLHACNGAPLPATPTALADAKRPAQPVGDIPPY